jgi:nitrite reductase (NADH) small subunit
MSIIPQHVNAAIPLCPLEEIPVGLGRSFEVGGLPIAVFRSRTGDVFAVANRCPHKGGPLSEGMLAGNRVVCPMHAFRFDSVTGECDQEGTCAVATYPVEVIAGEVRLTLPLAKN